MFLYRFFKKNKPILNSEFAAPVISGLLGGLVLSYQQVLWPFAFVFLTPLLYRLDEIRKKKESGKLMVFLLFFLFASIFIALSSLWMVSTIPLDWLKLDGIVINIVIVGGTWVLLVALMSVPIGLWGLGSFYFRESHFYAPVVGASLWVILEYVRSWLFVFGIYGREALIGPHHTYDVLGYALPFVPYFKELLPVGGIYLGSFVIVLCNYCFYYLISKKTYTHEYTKLKPTIFLVALLLAVVGTSVFVMKSIRSKDTGSLVEVTTVNSYFPRAHDLTQGNLKGAISYDYIMQKDNIGKIIVFPENFNPLPFFKNENRDDKNIDSLVIGSFPDENSYNLFFFYPPENKLEYYKKQLLMPLGEYNILWVEWFMKSIKMNEWLDAYKKIVGQTKRGTNTHVFQSTEESGLRIGGTLCSENISPYIFRDATRDGATLFVNLGSHILFYGSDLMFRQTVALNSVRALENGRYIVTALNHNPSFVISDTGKIVNVFDSQEVISSVTSKVFLRSYTTPYVRHGDIVVSMSFILCFVYLLARMYYLRR